MAAEYNVKVPTEGVYKVIASDGYEQIIDPEKGYSGTVYPGTYIIISAVEVRDKTNDNNFNVIPSD